MCPLQYPNHCISILSFYGFSFTSLSKAIEHLSILLFILLFITPPIVLSKLRFKIIFFQNTDERKMLNSTGQELISTELHQKTTSVIMNLHCQWHLASVGQTIVQVCHVDCMGNFSVVEMSGSIKSKPIKDYVTLTLTLLSIGINLF